MILEVRVRNSKAKIGFDRERKRIKDLQELHTSNKSLGIDYFDRPIFLGDAVKILTSSQKGPFKEEKKAIVVGKSPQHACRVLVGEIEDVESHNLLVVTEDDDASVVK